MHDVSLVVVGSGIKALSHLSVETKAYIQNANKVLYLVNEPITQAWISKNGMNAESLDKIYYQYDTRIKSYLAISDYILENLRKKQHVCVVIYGHPCFFARPGLEAVKRAKEEGYDARILPAISAEDCLFTDLLIDPASCGSQSYDATDFLIYQRNFDTSSHMILFQISSIGAYQQARFHDNSKNIQILTEYLMNFYSAKHEVKLYVAAQRPRENPYVVTLNLEELPFAHIAPLATLYIPPGSNSIVSKAMLKRLSIEISE